MAGRAAGLGALIGGTAEMRALLSRAALAAGGQRSLLLHGESGTGRETLARAIHDDTRTSAPFVVVDLAATPPELVEATVFGYEVSTFVGGLKVTRGAFETAESGTVLLREVASLPLETQVSLAKSLLTRKYTRAGAVTQRPITARVIATTHCDLERLVDEGAFHGDLRRAIAEGGTFALPPLRERQGDLPALVAHFGKRPFAPAQLARLAALPWPGNLRDLERAVAAILTDRRDAITELELLAAIAAAPDEDASRLVYADLLAERGDPRGELIQVQCRLVRGEGDARRLRAAEMRLLDAHATSWKSAAIELASEPSTPASAKLRRGFVESIAAPVDVLHRLDRLFEIAPTLDDLALAGVPGTQHFVSPHLRRLRTLHVQLAAHDWARVEEAPAPELALLAACAHLEGLRSLALEPATERLQSLASRDTLAALARSPHLAGLVQLTLDSISIQNDPGPLLDEHARWQLRELALRDCGLDAAGIERLVAAPGARNLRVLDLEGNQLGAHGIELLARAELSSLELLRIANVGPDWAAISPEPLAALRSSPSLANTAIYLGGQLLER